MIYDAAIEKVLFGPMNVVENDTLIVRKDLAMIIDSPPRFVQAFFRPVHWGLSKPQFHHLWTLVLSILLNLRRAKPTHLADALPAHTHRTTHGVFLSRSDEWELRPGEVWQRTLNKQIKSIKTVAVFVGPKGPGPWQDLELMAFLNKFAKRKCRVIPVILAERKGSPRLPELLTLVQRVDFRESDPDPFEQLVYGITGERGALGRGGI